MREKLAPLLKEHAAASKLRDDALKKIKGSKGKEADLEPDELKAAKNLAHQCWGRNKEIDPKMRKVIYTEEEERNLSVGRGSQGYHYLGSAKIYGRIGEAFASAMAKLNDIETDKQ